MHLKTGDVLGRQLAELIIAARRMRHQGTSDFLATGDRPALGERVELSAVRADGTDFPAEVAVLEIGVVHDEVDLP